MVQAKDLIRRFGALTAVAGVSIEAGPGVCALLGPNGAGKSTLLKLIAGLLAPDQGSTAICGINVAKRPMEVRRLIGVVPDDLGLFDSLTVEEHFDLSGSVYHLNRAETRSRTADLLRALHLEQGRATLLGQCSHGMRKKTALGMALLHNPPVLLLDEPFEGIDPVASLTIEEMLRAAGARGTTVFLTSHTLPVIERLADTILMIRDGRIVWNSAIHPKTGPLEEMYLKLVEPPASVSLDWLGRR